VPDDGIRECSSDQIVRDKRKRKHNVVFYFRIKTYELKPSKDVVSFAEALAEGQKWKCSEDLLQRADEFQRRHSVLHAAGNENHMSADVESLPNASSPFTQHENLAQSIDVTDDMETSGMPEIDANLEPTVYLGLPKCGVKIKFTDPGKKSNAHIFPNDDCLYGCIRYFINNRSVDADPSRAKAIRAELISRLRSKGQIEEAERLSLRGEEGYPNHRSYPTLCQMAGINMAVLNSELETPMMLIFGENGNDPVSLVIRLHRVPDGEGHLSWHFDVIRHGDQILQHPSESTNGVASLSDPILVLPLEPVIPTPTVSNPAQAGENDDVQNEAAHSHQVPAAKSCDGSSDSLGTQLPLPDAETIQGQILLKQIHAETNSAPTVVRVAAALFVGNNGQGLTSLMGAPVAEPYTAHAEPAATQMRLGSETCSVRLRTHAHPLTWTTFSPPRCNAYWIRNGQL
jgi:hypothetical protein